MTSMREPQVVESAQIAPHACKCGNTAGPFLDTFFEDAAGRLYVCKRCAKTYARIFGFAAGKKLDELENATVLVEQKDAELAKLTLTNEELRLQGGSDRAAIKELRGRLEQVQGALQTTRHMAASIEQASHELVEAVAPKPVVEAVA